MSSLHVHGRATPTSRVIRRDRTLKSPLAASSPTKRQTRPRAAGIAAATPSQNQVPDYAAQIVSASLPVEADFRGLDILSAIDYLKHLQSSHTHFPPLSSRERRTAILNRRRNMPRIVLAHQITSLFPDMQHLDREIQFLVHERRIVMLTLQDGGTAYMRVEDLHPPPELLEACTTHLTSSSSSSFPPASSANAVGSPSWHGGKDDVDDVTRGLGDDQVRAFVEAGYLLRRNGRMVLSAPNIGAYFSTLRSVRTWVCTLLRKAGTNAGGSGSGAGIGTGGGGSGSRGGVTARTGGIALEKDVRARYDAWKDGGIFTWELVMHDLVGSSRVEVLMLTVGRALRLTKRGREER